MLPVIFERIGIFIWYIRKAINCSDNFSYSPKKAAFFNGVIQNCTGRVAFNFTENGISLLSLDTCRVCFVHLMLIPCLKFKIGHRKDVLCEDIFAYKHTHTNLGYGLRAFPAPTAIICYGTRDRNNLQNPLQNVIKQSEKND